MENEKTINKSNTLMKKTKAQLIEIILRKDEVERSLRETLKDNQKAYEKDVKIMTNNMSNIQDAYKITSDEYCKLKNDYIDQCDEHALERQELINKATRYKTLFYFSLMVIIIMGIYITL